MDRRRRFHRRETWIARYTTSTTEESKCHLSKGCGRRGKTSGAPRSQSRIPETTTLTVTKARIASDAKRRSSRATRRRERLSCVNIRAIRRRRCARWTMTRPAKANPTSAWMALRMWRSCRVPSAAAAKAKRPRCTSQRDLVRQAVRDRGRRSAGVPTALPRAAPWFSVSMFPRNLGSVQVCGLSAAQGGGLSGPADRLLHSGQAPEWGACASSGTRYWASGLPQPVTGSQPGPAL